MVILSESVELRGTVGCEEKAMMLRNKIGVWMLALSIAALMPPLLMLSQDAKSQKIPELKLRLEPGKLVNGVPESFTFVFVNVSKHEVRMPIPSLCSGGIYGMVSLFLGLTVKPGPKSVLGYGCGGGVGGSGQELTMRNQAKNWKVLKPGESLKVSVNRSKLFPNQQAPGTYEFWAEYAPPTISAEDQRALEEGVDFPRTHLVSPHLVFVRKK